MSHIHPSSDINSSPAEVSEEVAVAPVEGVAEAVYLAEAAVAPGVEAAYWSVTPLKPREPRLLLHKRFEHNR